MRPLRERSTGKLVFRWFFAYHFFIYLQISDFKISIFRK